MQQYLDRLSQELRLRNYSHSTIKSYQTCLRYYFGFLLSQKIAIENGTDIRYIQELLGHQNIRTTQIYTKVTNPSIRNIKSPL